MKGIALGRLGPTAEYKFRATANPQPWGAVEIGTELELLVRLMDMFAQAAKGCEPGRSPFRALSGWWGFGAALCRGLTAGACAIALVGCGTDRSNADDAAVPPPSTTLTPLPIPPGDADAGVDAAVPPAIEEAGAPTDAGMPRLDAEVTAPPVDAGDVGPLRLNEAMSQNDGAWVDEFGEADDWVELFNPGSESVWLSRYRILDTSGAIARLPEVELRAGGRIVLFADDSPEQGPLHLPFKLGSDGDELALIDDADEIVDRLTLPELALNEALARHPDGIGDAAVCRYATPGRQNGQACVPPPPPSLDSAVEFEAFSFGDEFPQRRNTLVIAELSLRPGEGQPAFVELLNASESELDVAEFQLNLSPHQPSEPWPTASEGSNLALPASTLEPGQRLALEIPTDLLLTLEEDPAFEGVMTLMRADDMSAIDRIDFMHWPAGATLARRPDAAVTSRFCTNATPGASNTCEVLAERPIGDRVRALRTPADFANLAEGATQLGISPVKFVADLEAPGLVHFLAAARWPLHYTFVRERIYGQPELDRCDADENAEFYDGWVEFSYDEYYNTGQRRFHLGTLVQHAGANIASVEFTTGDAITAEGMREAFYVVVQRAYDPARWVVRPQGDDQVQRVRAIEGTLPLVSPEAPFENVTYQPLTEGVAYGTLRFITAKELESSALGPDVVVVTDDVPNAIPLVGGLVTEAFQTPLAHVNVLSQNRGTPNASLVDAREELAEYFDRLVRLEVSDAGLLVELADPEEAVAFWEERASSGPLVSPRLDTTLRGVQPLDMHDLNSLPAIGAKAAQLSELGRVDIAVDYCSGAIRPRVPEAAFALPVVHYLEHFEASGARDLLDELRADPVWAAEPESRAAGLTAVREMIALHPVEDDLLQEVEAAVRERFGQERVRFRSSSNTEDLPSFNGAGLYTSISAELGDPERRVDDAIRTVWASLWNLRAYDERAYANIDDTDVAMGILVHPASLSEEANGVAVSRNVLDPDRGDIYYLNAQVGEASVTNPAPGVTTEQLIYRWGRTPPIIRSGQSSLLDALGGSSDVVLTAAEVEEVSCALRGIHAWFRPLLDPEQNNRWFAMEIEFKLDDQTRELRIKQARPHSFGHAESFGDCRDL